MTDNFVVGDYIIDSFGIYRVTDINTGTTFKGDSCTMLCYEPVWDSNKKYTAQIPLNDLRKTGTRKVLDTSEIKTVMKNLSSEKKMDGFELNVVKEDIYQNDPLKVSAILTYLWKNKEILDKGNKDLMEKVLEHLCREICFVTKHKYNKVRDGVVSLLNKPN